MVRSRYCIVIINLLILGGSFACGLLNNESRGLWSVASWKYFALSKDIWSLDIVNSTGRASCSICDYLLSVSVNVWLT